MTAAPSTNIFASRETEMLLRSLSLRRLSYVVYTGERNQFLAQLPAIQERLVDVLRPGVVAPIVHSEVYLCMRVLLCRLSPHNLSSFWPVILTELVGLDGPIPPLLLIDSWFVRSGKVSSLPAGTRHSTIRQVGRPATCAVNVQVP